MLVVTSTITAICTTMVKEKMTSNGKPKTNGHKGVCPFHHTIETSVETWKTDIAEIIIIWICT